MCGIAGFASRAEVADRNVAAVLSERLTRRGPDGAWHFSRCNVELVQTRLAVVDLSDKVTYPIPNEDENVWLVFNGEIYDHHVMRQELEVLGHQFRTRCDAEVVVHAYEEWGDKAFGRLNGMFALAILDERCKELVLARDQFGIKPLVQTVTGRFAFASDAVALVSAGLTAGEIDADAMAEFAAFNYIPPPLTGLRAIEHVPTGVAIHRRADGTETSMPFASSPFAGDPRQAPVDPKALNAALQQAVRRQLRADVDVGVLLSGGMDSALLLSCAVDAEVRPRAYTVAFARYGDYDESARAARLATALGGEHEIATFSSGFETAVNSVASAFDQPFADSSAIATPQLARLAKSSSTVVLSGTGSDELFAGYYRVRAPPHATLVKRSRCDHAPSSGFASGQRK